jgi:ABC-type Fe3+ transport system substrate-binding protein
MRNLAQQGPVLHNGYTKLTQLLAAGEVPLVAFTQVTKVEKMREKGAPVDWVSSEPSFASVSSVGIAKNAPHPATARLLVDFYLSEEGQKAMREMDKVPLRRGIDPDSKRISELLDKNLHVIKYEGDAGRYIRLFNEIFLGR